MPAPALLIAVECVVACADTRCFLEAVRARAAARRREVQQVIADARRAVRGTGRRLHESRSVLADRPVRPRTKDPESAPAE